LPKKPTSGGSPSRERNETISAGVHQGCVLPRAQEGAAVYGVALALDGQFNGKRGEVGGGVDERVIDEHL